ncbi:hypothetical protein [Capnocytophaga leadbetteri]|uniref:hypothetical protein n=1 Tax=Capnocytophaga leadbetteri TaxID=327575 RepID=UPI0028E7A076|nr:hypothetical protein [Capnocytophaga leadbetteri]
MKIFVLLLFAFLSALQLKGQVAQIAINPTLQEHLLANHTVREASMANIQNMYEKQNRWYQNAQAKMAQVLLVHEQIYQALYNVNSLFKNAKQLKYIYADLKECGKNLSRALRISTQKPQYAIWGRKYYRDTSNRLNELRLMVFQILNEGGEKLLMDAYDREMLLDTFHFKVQMLNISALNIINAIEYNESRSYIYSIPIFSTYIEQDKMIIEHIMQQYGNLYK